MNNSTTQSFDDLPYTLNIPLPLVITRINETSEDYIRHAIEDNKSPVKITLYTYGISALLIALIFGMIGNFYTALIILSIMAILLWLCQKMASRSLNKHNKEMQAYLDGLAKTTPFIVVNHQNCCVYNRKGDMVINVPTSTIKSFAIVFERYRGGLVTYGIKIKQKNSFFNKLYYDMLGIEGKGCFLFFEHQSKKYSLTNHTAEWLSKSVIDMLQKDPNATHFPFKRKNLTNGRTWDSP